MVGKIGVTTMVGGSETEEVIVDCVTTRGVEKGCWGKIGKKKLEVEALGTESVVSSNTIISNIM